MAETDKQILVAVDGSRASFSALNRGIQLVRELSAS
jgi:hypothetical protein